MRSVLNDAFTFSGLPEIATDWSTGPAFLSYGSDVVWIETEFDWNLEVLNLSTQVVVPEADTYVIWHGPLYGLLKLFQTGISVGTKRLALYLTEALVVGAKLTDVGTSLFF